MGTLRFTLALAVVLGHSDCIFGYCIIAGPSAVEIFFIISGFLIALILNEKYGREQIWLFYSNRALRIYVPYLFVLAASLLLAGALAAALGTVPGNVGALLSAAGQFGPGTWAYVILTNLAIIGQDWAYWLAYDGGALHFTDDFQDSPVPVWFFAVVAPAWTLSLELTFYALAPFLVRNVPLLLLAFAASYAARQLGIEHGLTYDPWTYRFLPFELCLFFAGAIAYHIYAFFRPLIERRLFASAIIAAAALACILGSSRIVADDTGVRYFFVGLFLAMPCLFAVNKAWKFDRFLGDLSYPIYLIHWPVVTMLLDQGVWNPTWRGLWCVVITVALAYVFVRAIETPLDVARQRRVTARKETAAPARRPAAWRGGVLGADLWRMIDQWGARLASHRGKVYRLLWVCSAIFLATSVIQYAGLTRTEILRGPFQRLANGDYAAEIGTDIPYLSIASASAPGEDAPRMPVVKLRASGEAVAEQELSGRIIQDALFGIPGLRRILNFQLPDGVANDPSTAILVRYQIRIYAGLYDGLRVAEFLLILLALLAANLLAAGRLPSGPSAGPAEMQELPRRRMPMGSLFERTAQDRG